MRTPAGHGPNSMATSDADDAGARRGRRWPGTRGIGDRHARGRPRRAAGRGDRVGTPREGDRRLPRLSCPPGRQGGSRLTARGARTRRRPHRPRVGEARRERDDAGGRRRRGRPQRRHGGLRGGGRATVSMTRGAAAAPATATAAVPAPTFASAEPGSSSIMWTIVPTRTVAPVAIRSHHASIGVGSGAPEEGLARASSATGHEVRPATRSTRADPAGSPGRGRSA